MTEHAPGRRIDVMGEGPVVLMWHGGSTDIRAALEPLAVSVAARGRQVLVPDWNPSAQDLGRTDLFTSLRYARELAGDGGLTLLGWSMGGIAAASITLHQRRLSIHLNRTVLVAAAPFPRTDPVSGKRLGPAAPPVERSTTVAFVHARRDHLMSADAARATQEQWDQAGWETSLTTVDADHFSIVTEAAEDVAAVVVGG